MTRTRLPTRRENCTGVARWPLGSGRRVHVTVGFADDGKPLEVFLRGGGATGSDVDFLLDDIAVLISRALQHGDTLADIANGVGRSPSGEVVSLLGAVVLACIEMADERAAAPTIDARSDETAQRARPEGRERDGAPAPGRPYNPNATLPLTGILTEEGK